MDNTIQATRLEVAGVRRALIYLALALAAGCSIPDVDVHAYFNGRALCGKDGVRLTGAWDRTSCPRCRDSIGKAAKREIYNW